MLTALRDIFKRSARRLGLEPATQLMEVERAWAEVVGPRLAVVASPRELRGGVLLVGAVHAAAAQEVHLRQREILMGLRGRVPDAELRRVRVVVLPARGSG